METIEENKAKDSASLSLISKKRTYNSVVITLDEICGVYYIVDSLLKEFEGKTD